MKTKDMKPLRVLMVSHYYPPHLGGIEVVAYNEAKHLASIGCIVTLVTSKVSGDEQSGLFEGVNVVRVKALNFFEKCDIPFPIFSPWVLPILMKFTKHADVVHIHDAFYMSSFIASLCARWFQKPLVLTQHVAMVAHPSKVITIIQKLVYKTSGAFIFRQSVKIITLNDRVEQFLVEGGVPKSKLLALPNGVDTDVFFPANAFEKKSLRKEFGLSLDKKIVLFVGRFVPKKGFDILFEARDNDYQIVFVGGNSPDSVRPGTIFLGKLNQQTLAKVYRSADIFVLPSKDEGFPLSIQEAMASGLPVITTNDQGYARYKFDKEKFSLLDNPTSASVCQTIKSVIHDASRLRAMATYSHEYARTSFSWPIIMQQLTAVYNGLIKSK